MTATQKAALRSTTLMGAASITNLVLGIVRVKAVALLVGATGLGVIGLLQNLMTAAAAIGGLGLSASAPREIAAQSETGGPAAEMTVRRAVVSASIALGILTAILMFLFRGLIARLVLGDPALGAAIGWLGFGVALSVIYAGQAALLSGLQRISDLARATIAGALLGSIIGVAAVWVAPAAGLLVYVIAAPACSVAAALFFTPRIPKHGTDAASLARTAAIWRDLVSLGAATMVGSFIAASGPLVVRIVIGDRVGLHELGLFQASWAIASVYLGIVLQAMSADYFPRLSRMIADRPAALRLVNEQTELALLLGGPIILVVLGAAPSILQILYAREFGAAAAMLRWQMLGDVLKIMSWPVGFVLLAQRRGITFLMLELLATVVFVGATIILLDRMGYTAAGVGYLLMYAIYLPVLYGVCRRQIAFRWESRIVIEGLVLAAVGALLFLIASYDERWGLAVGTIAAVSFGLRSVRRVGAMLGWWRSANEREVAGE